MLHFQRAESDRHRPLPTTLIISVPLANAPQAIVALWSGVRGSTAIIDTPATLSAILD